VNVEHDWQKWGYDQGLPDHYPAMAIYGGSEGILQLFAAAKENDHLIGLHENYVGLCACVSDFGGIRGRGAGAGKSQPKNRSPEKNSLSYFP
jgi:hypothetical protein